MSTLVFDVALATRYLAGRKLRSVLTTLAIVFGVAMFFGLGLVGPTMRAAVQRTLASAAGAADLTITHVTTGTFDAAAVDTVKDTPGVQGAAGLLQKSLVLPTGPARVVTLVGADPAGLRSAGLSIAAAPVTAGRFLAASDRSAAVLSEILARDLGAGVGDRITLPSYSGTATFEVVGLVSTPKSEVDLPLGAAQDLLGQPGRINTVVGAFAAGADRDAVTSAVRSRLGDDYKVGPAQAGGAFQTTLRLTEIQFGLLGLLALLAAALIIYNTFRTIVSERRRDIALLRAIGASRRTVVSITLAESVAQAVVGTAAGLLLGYLVGAAGMQVEARSGGQIVGIEFAWPVPSFEGIASSVALGVGMTLAGTLPPAFAAARVTPLEALRPLARPVPRWTIGRRAVAGIVLVVVGAANVATGTPAFMTLGTAAFIVGLLLATPASIRPIAVAFGRLAALAFAREGRLASGNVARDPGRAAITASTMMVGLAIAVAVTGLIASIADGWAGYLDRTLSADYVVLPRSLRLSGGDQGAGPELAQRIARISGIAAVTSLRIGASEARGGPLQVIGIDPATYPEVAGLDFTQGDPGQAYAALGRGHAIVLNPLLALQMKAGPGDTVTLKTPEGDRAYAVAAIAVDYLNAGLATAYISQADLSTDFHETSDVLLMANAAPGADPTTLRAALDAVVSAYPALTLYGSQALRAAQTAILDALVKGIYVLLLVFAIPGLIAMVNTLVINVLERTRELGMLRAIGATRGQIGRIILGESFLLAGVGVAFGIPAGLWLGYVLVLGTNVIYPEAYSFPAAAVLATIAVGLLFGVLAGLLPARQAARMPIVSALRYE